MTKFLTLCVAIAGLALISIETHAMAGFLGSRVLFSELSGTVVLGGQPCSGARLVQTVSDGGREETSVETTTNDDGTFEFAEVSKKNGFLSLLPGEFVAAQQILIYFDDREYQGWISTKRKPEANAESDGSTFNLVCDLDRDPEYSDKHFGVCRLVSVSK